MRSKEVGGEIMGSVNHLPLVVGGKRGKRQRSAIVVVEQSHGLVCSVSPSSDKGYGRTEEEEEKAMADCLILLAQGDGLFPERVSSGGLRKKNPVRKMDDVTVTTSSIAGKIANFYVYECQTCNRSFPSFQALGGHRASHKRPKVMVQEKMEGIDHNRHSLCLQLAIVNDNHNASCSNGGKTKTHECSICGSVFPSGQALGGHMRRHRQNMNPETKRRNVLLFDLNLPAPEHDDRLSCESKFQFPYPPQDLVFSGAVVAPSLVDCHY